VRRYSSRVCPEAFDHDAEDVRRVAVDVFLARLRVERQRGHAEQRGGNRLVAMGEVPPRDPGLLPQLGGRPAAVAEAGGVGHQVANGDRTPGVHDVVPALAGDRHPRLEELGEVLAHGIGDEQPALLLEAHGGHAHEGLGLRRDAEDRVFGHGRARLEVAVAERHEVGDLAVPRHEHDRARELAVLYVALEGVGEPLQALRGEADLLRLRPWQPLAQERRGGEGEEERGRAQTRDESGPRPSGIGRLHGWAPT